jgi:hypothetical protein
MWRPAECCMRPNDPAREACSCQRDNHASNVVDKANSQIFARPNTGHCTEIAVHTACWQHIYTHMHTELSLSHTYTQTHIHTNKTQPHTHICARQTRDGCTATYICAAHSSYAHAPITTSDSRPCDFQAQLRDPNARSGLQRKKRTWKSSTVATTRKNPRPSSGRCSSISRLTLEII